MRAHAELIKQWAEDEALEVEVMDTGGRWTACFPPTFSPSHKYRIKPKEKKKVEMWQWAVRNKQSMHVTATSFATSEKALYRLYPPWNWDFLGRIEGSKIEVEE